MPRKLKREIFTNWDSVSQANVFKTIDLYKESEYNYATAYKLGRICLLVWRIKQTSTSYWVAPKTLDSDMLPPDSLFCSSVMLDVNGYILNDCGMVYVSSNGAIGFQAGASGGTWNAGSSMWIIKS